MFYTFPFAGCSCLQVNYGQLGVDKKNTGGRILLGWQDFVQISSTWTSGSYIFGGHPKNVYKNPAKKAAT